MAPDMAIVAFAVSASGPELEPSRTDVNERASKVLAALRELGMAEADIDAPDIAIQPEYDYRRGQKLTGYRVVRNMSARVRDLDRLGDVLDALAQTGSNEIQGAQMAASDPSAAEHAALEAAVRAARAKAEAVARSAAVSLGAIRRIEEAEGWGGAPQPMFRMAAGAEGADASTEVVAGELRISRQVRVWFAID